MSFFSSCGSGLVPLQPKAASHEPITNRSYTSDRWYMSGSSLSFRVKEKLKSLNRVATGFTPLEVQPSFFFWRKDARRSPACHLPITQAQGITGNALYLPYCLRNSRERLMAGRRFRSHSCGFRKTTLKPLTGFVDETVILEHSDILQNVRMFPAADFSRHFIMRPSFLYDRRTN